MYSTSGRAGTRLSKSNRLLDLLSVQHSSRTNTHDAEKLGAKHLQILRVGWRNRLVCEHLMVELTQKSEKPSRMLYDGTPWQKYQKGVVVNIKLSVFARRSLPDGGPSTVFPSLG